MEWILIAIISIGANVFQYGENEKLQQTVEEIKTERVQCEKIVTENQRGLAERDNKIREIRKGHADKLRHLDSLGDGLGDGCLLQRLPSDLQKILRDATAPVA